MADINKIRVNGTTYNIKDETSRSDIQEIKESINVLLESLSNSSFNGEKPVMPWTQND